MLRVNNLQHIDLNMLGLRDIKERTGHWSFYTRIIMKILCPPRKYLSRTCHLYNQFIAADDKISCYIITFTAINNIHDTETVGRKELFQNLTHSQASKCEGKVLETSNFFKNNKTWSKKYYKNYYSVNFFIQKKKKQHMICRIL